MIYTEPVQQISYTVVVYHTENIYYKAVGICHAHKSNSLVMENK